MGYTAQSLSSQGPYIPPGLSRPLRSGADVRNVLIYTCLYMHAHVYVTVHVYTHIAYTYMNKRRKIRLGFRPGYSSV